MDFLDLLMNLLVRYKDSVDLTNCRLQFMDALFVNEFMNLTSMDEIQDSVRSQSPSSRSSWPSIFLVPQFSYDAELKLKQGNAVYRGKGTLLFPDPKRKSNILEGLVQEIVRYKLYVTDKDLNTVG